jgi:hypothetical protein
VKKAKNEAEWASHPDDVLVSAPASKFAFSYASVSVSISVAASASASAPTSTSRRVSVWFVILLSITCCNGVCLYLVVDDVCLYLVVDDLCLYLVVDDVCFVSRPFLRQGGRVGVMLGRRWDGKWHFLLYTRTPRWSSHRCLRTCEPHVHVVGAQKVTDL